RQGDAGAREPDPVRAADRGDAVGGRRSRGVGDALPGRSAGSPLRPSRRLGDPPGEHAAQLRRGARGGGRAAPGPPPPPRATADGHVVVLHDPLLERTTDGAGPVRERTLAELQALDAGYHFTAPDGGHPWRGRGVRVPTLDELLAAHPGVPLNIEVKQDEPA